MKRAFNLKSVAAYMAGLVGLLGVMVSVNVYANEELAGVELGQRGEVFAYYGNGWNSFNGDWHRRVICAWVNGDSIEQNVHLTGTSVKPLCKAAIEVVREQLSS